jgi:hypothetical protein
VLNAIKKGTLLEDEDWFFHQISEMTEFKVSAWDLMHTYTYIECLKLREYLTIKYTKEEAYRKDAKLREK